MKCLKEDGSLDVERIHQLPIEEYIEVVRGMTQEQYRYYSSISPLNEGDEPIKVINPGYSLEEAIERGLVVKADYLNNWKERLMKRL